MGADAALPGREAIGVALLADGPATLEALIEKARCSEEERARIEKLASDLVGRARDGRHEQGGVDSFCTNMACPARRGFCCSASPKPCCAFPMPPPPTG